MYTKLPTHLPIPPPVNLFNAFILYLRSINLYSVVFYMPDVIAVRNELRP